MLFFLHAIEADIAKIWVDGIKATGLSNSRSIPVYNVLSATYVNSVITIRYAEQVNKSKVRPALLQFPLTQSKESSTSVLNAAKNWIDCLYSVAYRQSQLYKQIKVLINPLGGKGLAGDLYECEIAPIFAAAFCIVHVEETRRAGHAAEIAQGLDIDRWGVVACCSGDGLPHEVFNGLGRREDARLALSKVAVTCLPCGSGNGLCLNLNGTSSPSQAALAVVKGKRMPLDLVSVTQGNRRTLSFLSQAVGSIADADLGTEHMRWMGEARFTYGVLKAIMSKRTCACDVAIHVRSDDKADIRENYGLERERLQKNNRDGNNREDELMAIERRRGAEGPGLPALRFGTVNSPLPSTMPLIPYRDLATFWAGNMSYMSADANVFPAALPSDGAMDVVLINGSISRLTALQNLLAVEKGTFFDRETVRYLKAEAVRVVPHGWEEKRERQTPGGGDDTEQRGRKSSIVGNISIDGERFPFEPFQAEVHRGLGTVLSRSGKLYETDGMG